MTLNAKGGSGRSDSDSETFIPTTFNWQEARDFQTVEDASGPLIVNQTQAVMTLAIRGRGDSHDLEYREDGTANAILTPNGGRGGVGVGAVAAFGGAAAAVRRLTPRECERLQAFPDDYTLITYRAKPAADGPRYKALGNSMCTNVMRWIGERIQLVEDEANAPDLE